MDILFWLGIVSVAIIAGMVGSMFGIGGGIVIIPALMLGFGLPIKEVIGASMIGVIASSTGSASRYVGEGLVNIKLGMALEPATTIGSLAGAIIAVYLDQMVLAIIFAIVLMYGAIYMARKPEIGVCKATARKGVLDGTYINPRTGGTVTYNVKHFKRGLGGAFAAGGMSGMLGVGGGIVKVPVMNTWMGVPMRAATATSNFMIGVTALAGAAVFYS